MLTFSVGKENKSITFKTGENEHLEFNSSPTVRIVEVNPELDKLYEVINKKVDKTLTVAGIDLQDPITSDELMEALDLYIVNFEYNTNKWTKDKSFIEIQNAIRNDKIAIGLYNGKQYLCISRDEFQIKFSNANTPKLTILTVNYNESISYEEVPYVKDEEITNEEVLHLWNTIIK
jgi:hypothetical protein